MDQRWCMNHGGEGGGEIRVIRGEGMDRRWGGKNKKKI
jgi:hypothetical protein